MALAKIWSLTFKALSELTPQLSGGAGYCPVTWMPQSKLESLGVKATCPRFHKHCVCMAENRCFGKILNVPLYCIDIPAQVCLRKYFIEISAGHQAKTFCLLKHKLHLVPGCLNAFFSQLAAFWRLLY